MKRIATAALLGFLSACAPAQATLTGENVRVTANVQAVEQCTSIGTVRGSNRGLGGTVRETTSATNTIQRLREKTAEMGGNTLLVITQDGSLTSDIIQGKAYRC